MVTYSGVPSDFLNLLKRNWQFRNGEWLNTRDFDVELFLIPKLPAIFALSEFYAVVYERLLFFFYLLPVPTALFGSFVTHEPINYYIGLIFTILELFYKVWEIQIGINLIIQLNKK